MGIAAKTRLKKDSLRQHVFVNRYDQPLTRDGIAYILRKHAYPVGTVGRMLVRPAGGALLAFAFALMMNNFFHTLALWQWLSVAAIIIVGGTYGDLVESLLKRSIEIKDSGDSLPGHGGFLDRFDGLLISAPFIVAFLEIF